MTAAKPNNPGLGIDYEVYVPAYFALLLNINPEIEDFTLRSNVQDFGNLDDLLIDIKEKGGKNLHFAFQLKHKDDSSKRINPASFQQAGGNYSLEKYCKAFKKLNEENRNKYHFILYTNNKFESCRTSEVKKFCMKETQDVSTIYIFDTSDDSNNLYKFEVNEETEEEKDGNKKDYEEFFSKFTLYTGQANTRGFESLISKKLKYGECYVQTYIHFFRLWHRGDFIDKSLDKKTLNIHLVDILLTSVAINHHFSDGLDEYSIFFEKLVQQFDITIFDASAQYFIRQLKENVHKYPEEFNEEEKMIGLAKDRKFIEKSSNELTEETKLKLLRYFFKKPLILDFNKDSKNKIIEASKLCKLQETGIKLVIMGEDIDVSKFSHLKSFTNLTEIDEGFLEETLKRCNLSLQGRNISFDELFEDEIRKFVTPRAIFQMLKGSFSIGEDKEKLPESYIPRTVSTTVFDIKSVIIHSSRSNAIILYYEDKFEELKSLIQNIVDCHDYLYEDSPDALILKKQEASKNQLHQDTFPQIIMLRRKDCSRKQFDEIRKELRQDKENSRNEIYSNDRSDKEPKTKDVHLFQLVDENRCLLLMSTENIFYNPNYESTKMSVKENKIYTFFNNSINILCAQPGMGKSTLIKHLKNECDSNFWTVMVDLKAHNQFLKEKPSNNLDIDKVLKYFLELDNCKDKFLLKIKQMFLTKEKIVFFLDGLDEVDNECVDSVLKITERLNEKGFKIWLSARQNLQQKIENCFNIFSIEIDEINENQQKQYIEERLISQYNENEIEEIINNTDLANNRQILEIPLQLHIITQIFLDGKSYYSNLSENNFILTKMFEIFFKGKYKHFLTKTGLKYTDKDEVRKDFLDKVLEEQLGKYEIVALHSVLDNEHFKKLELTQIRDWDFLGITKVNVEKKVVFEHLTYAEYFAAKFLVNNFDKARILKKEIFAEKYQNLRIIFSIMLAKDRPCHLAIIYKNLSQIQGMEESPLVDEGGRNSLQVVACVATRHPFLQLYRSEWLMDDCEVQHFKGEDCKIKVIVDRILLREPLKRDKIFEWDSLDYALAAGALYIVEAILEKYQEKYENPYPNFYEILGKYYGDGEYRDEVVAYYSIRFGYHRLLSEILVKKSCHVTRIGSNYLKGKDGGNPSILNFLFSTSESLDRMNRTKIVELLIGDNVNKTVYDKDGFTFLHFAVFHSNTELVKYLLGKRADVNIQDKDGWSPLYWAVKRNNLEILKLLVEKVADVNIKDKTGRSPLFWAVEGNNLEISKFLLERGADVNIKDNDVWSLRYWLGKNGRGWTPLFLAVYQNNLDILKLLIENRADVNIQDKDGKSPLFWAIDRDNLEASKLLIEKKAEVNIKDKKEMSPLMLAAERSNFEISKLLVEKKADVNAQDENGRRPLYWAVTGNNLEIKKMLVESGADANIIKSVHRKTPLFYCQSKYRHLRGSCLEERTRRDQDET